MAMRNPNDWMWADALGMIARAERLHRQMFQPTPARSAHLGWEPPVDVLETPTEVLILAALPGVAEGQVEAVIDGAELVISGVRALPDAFRTAVIHRLELPQGRFERRVPLPAGRYDQVSRQMIDGCLAVTLHKSA
ncbi:Hsp20/alpha crystallin family protein [Phenylobacterium sp.]|uniref:Hsp20/alpha crystallin family protein n=1 Tax=Phenylobacterium sp. TaxID=1871053 RepID=UPI00273635F8|nr:Hsp20/alpha crystallin family protein [Phenylobacterium sp.]MDP3659656.1 Hsp20/alpha crystallin family protein [Phenylobacterium sp.]